MSRHAAVLYPDQPFNTECQIEMECKEISDIPDDIYFNRSFNTSTDNDGDIYHYWEVSHLPCTKQEKINALQYRIDVANQNIKKHENTQRSISISLETYERQQQHFQKSKEVILFRMALIEMIEKYW